MSAICVGKKIISILEYRNDGCGRYILCMKKKTCTKCGERKLTRDFYTNRRKDRPKESLESRCKLCAKTHSSAHASSDHGKSHRANVRQRNRRYVYGFLQQSKCADCGDKRWQVLEFDHVRGTKLCNISSMYSCRSIDSIRREIEKCDVRCANCHRMKTTKQLEHYKGDWDNLSHVVFTSPPRKRTAHRGERHHNAVLKVRQVRRIRNRYATGGVSFRTLARQYKVSISNIKGIVAKRIWKDI